MPKKRKPQPLAPPPQCSALKSRKRARQVTTLYHKYSQKRDEAIARAQASGCNFNDSSSAHRNESNGTKNDAPSSLRNALLEEVKKWDDKLSEIGGREEYQRASQMNTSLFSTSKWVLGVLGRWGWLDGLPINEKRVLQNEEEKKMKKNLPRRDIRLLEIGAINTQLLDAAARSRVRKPEQNACGKDQNTDNKQRVHRLEVHAIDIRSTDDRIQQIDFFDYPLPDNTQHDASNETADSSPPKRSPYDVLVNSMVINCVTTPEQRGRMLHLCYQQLRPGGVLFLMLPKLCLKQSKYMTCRYFEDILKDGLGFELLDNVAKDSPKLAFYVLKRPEIERERVWREDFGSMKMLNKGKKFRNEFAVKLSKNLCL